MGITEVRPPCPGCGSTKQVYRRATAPKDIYYGCHLCSYIWKVGRYDHQVRPVRSRTQTPADVLRKTCPKCGKVQTRCSKSSKPGRGYWYAECLCGAQWKSDIGGRNTLRNKRGSAWAEPKPVFSAVARERLKEFLK